MIEDKKKQEDSQAKHADVHEEGLGVEPFIELDNLGRIIVIFYLPLMVFNYRT